MSTLNVEAISHPTSGSNVTINGITPAGTNQLGNRNLIINGAMQVAQRGTQVTGVSTSGYLTVDRFKINFSSLGTWTIDQATDAPAGFTKSFKATCTTADASPAASDGVAMVYQFEAQDLQLLDFGASGAKSITLSFWVKSNKTGTATFAVFQLDNSNKLVSFEYSISSADTWEQKTITIPGDTAGVINDDNGAGLQFEWWFNSGSNYSSGSHQATWTTFAQGDRNPSNLGVGGATSDYFAITGVQLEVGEVATPFEHRSYSDELARCQRYYWNVFLGDETESNSAIAQGTNFNGGTSFFNLYPPVSMRASPSLEASNTANYYVAYHNSGSSNVSTLTFDSAAHPNVIEFSASTGGSGGQAIILRRQNASSILRFSAEL